MEFPFYQLQLCKFIIYILIQFELFYIKVYLLRKKTYYLFESQEYNFFFF